MTVAGLPDGFFLDPKSQFGYTLEELRMENVVIFSGYWEYDRTIGYILWAIDDFAVIWYIFPPFWYNLSRKICRRIAEHPRSVLFTNA
jgi:hypothetical protein